MAVTVAAHAGCSPPRHDEQRLGEPGWSAGTCVCATTGDFSTTSHELLSNPAGQCCAASARPTDHTGARWSPSCGLQSARITAARIYRQFIGALHVSYPGSQLEYATSYVAANPRTKLVSLMIGANDLFVLQHTCEGTDPGSVNTCISAGLPALLAQLRSNVTTIYQNLKDAGFTGDFVAVTYYALNYNDPLAVAITKAVDGVLAEVTVKDFGGKVADGFSAFAQASGSGEIRCAAGLLLIRLQSGSCDVHPSPAGAALLASAVRSAEGP